jgi:glycine cleavage system protein P-like pyridoxal-binding family
MNSVHPKIQVESKHDILYLIKELEESVKTIPGHDAVETEISSVIYNLIRSG